MRATATPEVVKKVTSRKRSHSGKHRRPPSRHELVISWASAIHDSKLWPQLVDSCFLDAAIDRQWRPSHLADLTSATRKKQKNI